MINNPPIANYKPFYIGTGSHNGACVDTRAIFGLIAKSNPYPILPSAKEPYRNDWLDENGADEYPVLHFETIEFSVSFYIRAEDTISGGTVTERAASIVRKNVQNFFDFVSRSPRVFFDSYTDIGYRDIRYKSFSEDSFEDVDGTARCVFTVTFQCNDPLTRCIKDGDYIVPQYGAVCTSGASTKTKSLTITDMPIIETVEGGVTKYEAYGGQRIGIKFSNANTNASPELRVSNSSGQTTARPIEIPSNLSTSDYAIFEYDTVNNKWLYIGLL